MPLSPRTLRPRRRVGQNLGFGFPDTLETGLISYMRLDGSTTLTAGTQSFTANAGVTWVTNPLPGGVFGTRTMARLSGAGYITADSQPSIPGAVTVSMWVRSTTTGSGEEAYVAAGLSGLNVGAAFLLRRIGDLVQRSGTSLQNIGVSNLPLRDGNWHFLCLRSAASSNRLDFDNQSFTHSPNSVGASPTFLTIGAAWDGSTYTRIANIWLMDVGIWNRALTDDEVAILYNGGRSLRYPIISDGYEIASLGGAPIVTQDGSNIRTVQYA